MIHGHIEGEFAPVHFVYPAAGIDMEIPRRVLLDVLKEWPTKHRWDRAIAVRAWWLLNQGVNLE